MRLILPALCVLGVLPWSASALAQNCNDLRSGLVSSWTGDENADDDVSGHHGQLNGALARVPGMVHGAFRFDGEDDYIDVPSSPDFDLGMDDFTIQAWINLSEVQSDEVYPIIMRGLCIAKDFSYADWLFFLYDGQIGFTRFDGMENTFSVSWTPVQNTWYHLAVVRSGDELRFYVDGQQRGDAVNIAGMDYGPGPVADMDVNIGREEGGVECVRKDRWWNGELDEIRLYHRALSGVEVEALCNMRGECKDSDGDGVKDVADLCVDSDLGETVMIDGVDTGVENTLVHDGCTLADLIDNLLASNPDVGPVIHELLDLASSGAISQNELGALVSLIVQNGGTDGIDITPTNDSDDPDIDDSDDSDIDDSDDPDIDDSDDSDVDDSDDPDIDDSDDSDDSDVDDSNDVDMDKKHCKKGKKHCRKKHCKKHDCKKGKKGKHCKKKHCKKHGKKKHHKKHCKKGH